jgi:ferredoxin/flavodoxin---NADP+ reductase
VGADLPDIGGFDVIVVGGTLAGLSLAVKAREAGLGRVLIVEPDRAVADPEVPGQHALTVEYQATVGDIEPIDEGTRVTTDRFTATATAVVLADRTELASPEPPFAVPDSVGGRVHLLPPDLDLSGSDVPVVGVDDGAAEEALRAVTAGARVVVALGGSTMAEFSRLASRKLLRLEAERRLTILWNAAPAGIEDLGGFPMVDFADRSTPTLQFDHVIYRIPPTTLVHSPGEVDPETGVFAIGPAPIEGEAVHVSPGQAWDVIRSLRFPDLPEPVPHAAPAGTDEAVDALRAQHYNATITRFDRTHSDLWLIRVKPDRGDTSHQAGQYASLGLGYWEPRADAAREPNIDAVWDKLIRRSYSISSPVLEESGYLAGPGDEELELYIVLVPPSGDRIPGLTPRLALKAEGDRIYLGPKVAGRYTLAHVTDPATQIVFLATGTGEAPHNDMIAELLRKGHTGTLVSAVSVRYRQDLAYDAVHRQLAERFANYHYLPVVTREEGTPKRYIQDLIEDGTIDAVLPAGLDPAVTHVYACGNPAMLGLPEVVEGGELMFPEPRGVAEILTGRGFTVDRRGVVGNVHFEEYW